MYLSKDSTSPFYKLIYIDKMGERKKVSTKEKRRRKAEVFMHNFVPPAECDAVPREAIDVCVPEIVNFSTKMTVEDFYAEYLEISEQTHSKHYSRSIKMSFKMLIEEFGNIGLVKLDRRNLEKFINKTFARTQRGAAHIYKTLKAAFTKAEEWGYISENPFKKFKLPKIPQSFPMFLTFEDIQKIISMEPREDLQRIYLLAYYTGMRRAEIINLTWESVDMERKLIRVSNANGFTTKSKKERIIPICEPLMIVLEELKKLKNEKSLYVFETMRGVKYHDETMGRNFKTALVAAGLNGKIHFHTLRHSFASELVQKGVSIYVVKELLGHSDISTTMIYSHLKQENLIDAMTAFDKQLKIA